MPAPAAPKFSTLLASAHALADASGKAIRPYFRRQLTIDNKARDGSYDPVTAGDRAAEKAISRILKAQWPDHGIIGEEFGTTRRDARFKWVIDPIDGTRSFVTGTPMWGTLIGILDGDRPILGMVDQPYTGERFWSGERSAMMRETGGKIRRIKSRACPKLAGAVLMTTHPDMFATAAELDAFYRLKSKARMTRYGGDCYSYCMLAAGFVDAVVEAGLQTYDVAALIPLIEKAGGVMTNWEGRSAADGGRVVATGDPALHEIILKILNS